MKKIIIVAIIMLTATASFAAMETSNYRLGAVIVPVAPGNVGRATTLGIRFPFVFVDLGVIVGQNAVGLNTTNGVLFRAEFGLPKAGDLNSHLGFSLLNIPSGNSSFGQFNLFAGFEYEPVKNLSVLADVSLLEICSAQGGSAAAAAGSIYGGARIYF